MTTLITGGAGFIGTRLTHALASAGHDVVVLDNLHPQVHGADPTLPGMPVGARFVRADVCDAPQVAKIVAETRPSLVYHLAAETGTGQSLTQSQRHSAVNVVGTAVLMDALSAAAIVPERLVLTSSRAVYGEGAWRGSSGTVHYPTQRLAADLDRGVWDPQLPDANGTPIAHQASAVQARPTNVYAATKLAQEHLLSAWAGSFGSSLATLRLQNVYGAGQALGNSYTGVLTYFARRALADQVVNVYEGGGIVRDFVHVSDVVNALVCAATAELAPGQTRTVDIGSGAPMTLADAAHTLVTTVGRGSVVITDDYRLGDVRVAYADNSAAEGWLGYSPTVGFSDGTAELAAWAAAELAG